MPTHSGFDCCSTTADGGLHQARVARAADARLGLAIVREPIRTFRSQFVIRPRLVRPAMLAAGVALTAGAGVAAEVGLPSNMFGRAAAVPERVSAEPGATAVIDGETMWPAGRVVRLRGADAPEWGMPCRDGMACGGAATTVLAQLVRERPVACHLAGQDRQGRPFAACDAGGADPSRAIVASGWARRDQGAGTGRPRSTGQAAGCWRVGRRSQVAPANSGIGLLQVRRLRPPAARPNFDFNGAGLPAEADQQQG